MTAQQIRQHPEHVGDVGDALTTMLGRYFAIPQAERDAALAQEHRVREAIAATYHVACHS